MGINNLGGISWVTKNLIRATAFVEQFNSQLLENPLLWVIVIVNRAGTGLQGASQCVYFVEARGS